MYWLSEEKVASLLEDASEVPLTLNQDCGLNNHVWSANSVAEKAKHDCVHEVRADVVHCPALETLNGGTLNGLTGWMSCACLTLYVNANEEAIAHCCGRALRYDGHQTGGPGSGSYQNEA